MDKNDFKEMNFKSLIPDWGDGKNLESPSDFLNAWYINQIGDNNFIQKIGTKLAAEANFNKHLNIKYDCPSENVIETAVELLSAIGIPTKVSDKHINQYGQWTGGPITKASLIGALRITLGFEQEEGAITSAVILFTAKKMVRVLVSSSSNDSTYSFKAICVEHRTKLICLILRVFGDFRFEKLSYWSHKVEDSDLTPGSAIRTMRVLWEDAEFNVLPDPSIMAFRFGLGDNHEFPKGVWVGDDSTALIKERYIASSSQQTW